jgi:hypothetical protein
MTWSTPVVGALTQGNVDTPMVVTAVSGIVAGTSDLFVWYSARPASGTAGAVNTPSGWTLIAIQNADAASIGGALFCRRATGSDGCTISTTAGSSVSAAAVMWRTSGGPATPVAAHVSSQTFNGSNATTIATSAITPTQPNAIVYACAARNWNDDSTGVTSWPSGSSMTTLAALGSSFGSNELSLLIGYVIQTTAAGISAGTITPTSGASLKNIVLMAASLPDVSTTAQWFQFQPAVQYLARR